MRREFGQGFKIDRARPQPMQLNMPAAAEPVKGRRKVRRKRPFPFVKARVESLPLQKKVLDQVLGVLGLDGISIVGKFAEYPPQQGLILQETLIDFNSIHRNSSKEDIQVSFWEFQGLISILQLARILVEI